MSERGAPTVPTAAGTGEEQPTYGRFVARGLLGRGGMGVVLRAYDPELDREVALKLLHRAGAVDDEATAGGRGDATAAHVRAEAQALAKLAHPNVVAVYEIGEVGTTAFIAMELVEGGSLRRWLAGGPPLRAIVPMFLACGHGLAAAHAAGLVHRDFKPDNVLIGPDGRPRVTDFGLVLRAGRDADDDGGGGGGAVAGTPAYMAPEQWTGGAIDARTDQFAFCVALWEALATSHPFADGGVDGDRGALREAVLSGRVRAPRRPMPRAIELALRRGLAVERELRWPSMPPLLDAIREAIAPSSSGRWIAPVVAGVVLAGIAVVLVVRDARKTHEERDPARDPCLVASARLDEAWTPARSVEIRTALGGGSAAAAAIATLDRYAGTWRTAARDACRSAAAHAPSVRDNQAACLARARVALGALASALADRGVTIDQATDAVARLPDIDACGDLERLATVIAPPADPALRARLDAVRNQLADVSALAVRGDPAGAIGLAEAAVAAARSIGHAPTLADALQTLGDLEMARGDLAAAEPHFRASASAAADGRDDHAAAYAWIRVVFLVAEERVRLDEAAALVPVAEAALRRAGQPRNLRFIFHSAAGTLEARRGELVAARAHFEAARAAAGDRREEGHAMSNLGNVAWQLDGAEAALPILREALAALEHARGAEHPETAEALYRLAAATNGAGQAAEARPLLARALAIQERVWGERNLNVALTLEALGNTDSNLRDYPASLAAFDRAIAIERAVDAPPAMVAMTRAARVIMLIEHQPDVALADFPAVIEALAAAIDTTSFDFLMVRASYADLLARVGRCGEAKRVLAALAALDAIPEGQGFVATIRARC